MSLSLCLLSYSPCNKNGVGPVLYCAGSATMKGREGCWLFDVDQAEAWATPVGWNGEGYEALPGKRKV